MANTAAREEQVNSIVSPRPSFTNTFFVFFRANYIIQDVQKKQQEIESDSFQQQVLIEKKALTALKNDRAEALFILDTFAAEQADYVLDAWHQLFWELITKYRDGYRMDDLRAKDFSPTKLFYPKWWLEQVGFFKNAEIYATNVTHNPGESGQPGVPPPHQPGQPGAPNSDNQPHDLAASSLVRDSQSLPASAIAAVAFPSLIVGVLLGVALATLPTWNRRKGYAPI